MTSSGSFNKSIPISDRALDQALQNLRLKKWKADPVSWIEDNFRIPETPNHRLQLGEYQKRALREALRRDEKTGRLVYSLVVWSDIKKSAKSTIAAAVALYRAMQVTYGQIYLVANDLDQADSRVGYYLRRGITLNPEFSSKIKMNSSSYKVILPGGTFIQSIPIDPSGEAGSNADHIVFSELWGAHEEAKERMWTEMTLSPTKYGESQRWVETYAGFSGQSVLLERIYTTAMQQCSRKWPDLEVFTNEEIGFFCMWNTEPRLPWQTKEYYASEAIALTDSEFRRVHRNQWVSPTESFIPIEWWDECLGDVPPLEPGEQVVVALDAAVSGDCFAIVGVSRRYRVVTTANGKKVKQYVIIPRFVRKWQPKPGRKLEYTNVRNPDDRDYPEGEVRHLRRTLNVVQYPYDPYQLHHFCTTLMQKGLGWFKSFDQGGRRLLSDKGLYDLIRDKNIINDGNPDLREHLMNADAKKDNEKLRIVKRSDVLKVDLAVALSMASYECLRLNLNDIPLEGFGNASNDTSSDENTK